MHEEQSQQVTGGAMVPPSEHCEVATKGVVAIHAQAKSKGKGNTMGAEMTPEKLANFVNQASTKMNEHQETLAELKSRRSEATMTKRIMPKEFF